MKTQNIRQHIVETASDLFYRQGYNLTGINEIIATANVAKATLYNHFKSKEDLCVAYLKYKNQTLIDSISEYVQQKRKGEKRVLAIIDFLNLFFESEDFNGCWCIRTVAEIPAEDVKIKAEIIKQKKALQAFILQIVKENLSEYSATKHKQIAQSTYMLYESAVAESHLQQDSWPINHALKMLKNLI